MRIVLQAVVAMSVAHVEQLHHFVSFLQKISHARFYKCDLLVIVGDLARKASKVATSAKEHRVNAYFFVDKLLYVDVVIMGDAHSFAPESYK